MAAVRVPQLPGPAAGGQPGPGAAAAAAALLQPAGQRAEAAALAAPAGLFIDLAVGPGDRLEALVRNRISAHHRDSIGPLLEPRLGALDRLERLLEVLSQCVVGPLLLEVVSLIAAVPRLIGGLRPADPLELLLDPGPLLGEPLARAWSASTARILLAGRAPAFSWL